MVASWIVVLIAPFVNSATGDFHIRVEKVELPEHGLNPENLSIVIHQSVKGCRIAIAPKIERHDNVIEVLPRSAPIEGRRIAASRPCGIATSRATQVAELGKLPQGNYKLRIKTGLNTVHKVLEVY
jgi:hypothetical protein